jgi:ATP-dependent exoDNAse (exonuclease V) alpha subunit
MILANDFDAGYVNGDCGHIVDANADGSFEIELVRNHEVVCVGRIVRHSELVTKMDGVDFTAVGCGEYVGRTHTRRRESPSGRSKIAGYVLGQVEFMPLRLAWASTVHKSQGLSLDKVQVDFRDRFFGSPAMLYVALSRCRTLDGLRLVGMREVFVRACRMDERVRNYV